MVTKNVTVHVKGYSYRKNGKKHNVKTHTKPIKKDVTTVTKSQYKKKASERSPASLKRDASRTKRNAISGNKKELPSNWNTKDHDWIGVDAKGYIKVPKKHTELPGGNPGYTVIKYSDKKNTTRYQARYNNKPIGPTTPINTLSAARGICKVHHGRRTGNIKNVNQEDYHRKQIHKNKNPYRHKDDPNYDDAYEDDKSWHDSSITGHENRMEAKERMSFRNMSIGW